MDASSVPQEAAGLQSRQSVTDEFILDELLAALEAAQRGEDGYDDAVRVETLCQRTGWSQTRVRARLRELLAAGNIECVRIPYRNISGNLSRVPAYRVIRRGDVE